MKYLSWNAHKNILDTEKILSEWISNYENKNYYRWAITLKDTGELIGGIDIILILENIDCVEFGYVLSKKFWNKGYMTEALKVTQKFMFEKVNVHRIQARHDVRNPSSGKVMTKTGMKFEGILRESDKSNTGEWVDSSIYSILRNEWEETMAKKIIKVVPYDPNWPEIFDNHAEELKKILDKNVVDVYHVGSTSVPELSAKPTVDIMCVVKDLKIVTEPLKSIGYTPKGEFNLPMRLFFSRKTPDDINLHVLKENNGEIKWNLCFQNYLRENKEAREMYAKTKLDLVNQNPNGFDVLHNSITNYTTGKGEIIRKIAKIAGFDGYRLVIAFNDYEIQMCKKLLNLNKIDLECENEIYVCLYKGVEITALAMLEFFDEFKKSKIIKINALNNESEIVLLNKINEWLEFKECVFIK